MYNVDRNTILDRMFKNNCLGIFVVQKYYSITTHISMFKPRELEGKPCDRMLKSRLIE